MLITESLKKIMTLTAAKSCSSLSPVLDEHIDFTIDLDESKSYIDFLDSNDGKIDLTECMYVCVEFRGSYKLPAGQDVTLKITTQRTYNEVFKLMQLIFASISTIGKFLIDPEYIKIEMKDVDELMLTITESKDDFQVTLGVVERSRKDIHYVSNIEALFFDSLAEVQAIRG